uniref:Protein kinase domain-containing protein n=1 Tax=Maylandia zebra TaxID=106582 RepID=A0A3P9CSN3_9CICH
EDVEHFGKHYKVEAFLGEGGFGIVAKCRDTTTNQAVAIKSTRATLIFCNRHMWKFSSWSSCEGWIQMPPTLFNGTAFPRRTAGLPEFES